MALTGPQKIPFAVTSGPSWYGDNYTGTPFEANVGVLHTTEGTTLPSYSGGASAPNVTGVPDFAASEIRWYQHYDVDRSSRALKNASGGVETNQLNAFQVELVGTCDPRTRDSWRAEGRKFVYWPEAPEWALKGVAELVRWLSDNHKIQIKSTVTWRAYPSSYGAFASQRLTGAEWEKYYGWLGHQHVPENDHGDPGDIDFDRVMQLALSGTGEGEVALTSDDVAKVFKTDGVLKAGDNSKTNPFWTAESYLYEILKVSKSAESVAKGARTDVAGVKLAVEALAAKVDSLSVGGVDLDALAVKVADELYKRMAQ